MAVGQIAFLVEVVLLHERQQLEGALLAVDVRLRTLAMFKQAVGQNRRTQFRIGSLIVMYSFLRPVVAVTLPVGMPLAMSDTRQVAAFGGSPGALTSTQASAETRTKWAQTGAAASTSTETPSRAETERFTPNPMCRHCGANQVSISSQHW